MTVIRPNILSSEDGRDRFLQGVVELNRPNTGIAALDLLRFLRARLPWFTMRGINQELSLWDLFVVWHYVAMQIQTPPDAQLRNLAHGGPIFLPWHRMFLIRLEEHLQAATDDDATAVPYWDWAATGELPADAQRNNALWRGGYLGESRGEVRSGPLGAMRVRIEQRTDGLWSIPPRRLQRAAGRVEDAPRLPTTADVEWALADGSYDVSGWDFQARQSFRNKAEGWLQRPGTPANPAQPGAQLHNRVHRWVGGDMGPGTSPNDPVFYLNHCQVDRMWEAWMATNGRTYRPTAAEQGDDVPDGHRANDTMVALLGSSLRPADVLDPAAWYEYDNLDLV